MRILLIGGSKSGKSGLAQTLCRRLAAGGPMIYWATMIPVDQEDQDRIRKHLEDRNGWGFTTVEQGRALGEAPRLPENAAVLFDSVTALLSNEMFSAAGMDADAAKRAGEDLLALSGTVRHFVCVADDLWRDAGAYDVWTERYRAGLAGICRRLAKEFDAVCEVSAGVPHLWKGALA